MTWNAAKLEQESQDVSVGSINRAFADARLRFLRSDRLAELAAARQAMGRSETPEYQMDAWYQLEGGDAAWINVDLVDDWSPEAEPPPAPQPAPEHQQQPAPAPPSNWLETMMQENEDAAAARLRLLRRYTELDQKVEYGSATPEEITEHSDLFRNLAELRR
jgi:hypothetical protein